MSFYHVQLLLDNPTTHKIFRAFASYMTIFGSKYISNDLQMTCGNLFNLPIIKVLTVYCIMYNATSIHRLSIVLTISIVILQYYLTTEPTCTTYVDPDHAHNLRLRKRKQQLNGD